mgnify:CR=1 FL=1
MILLIIFIISFVAILVIYSLFNIPFIPFKHKNWDSVIFNLLLIALALALAFDRGAVIVAMFILSGKIIYEKIKQTKEKFDQLKNKDKNGLV